MKSLLVMVLLLSCLSSGSAMAKNYPPEVQSFLDSRRVLGSVYFPPGSHTLTGAAKKAIDRTVAEIDALDLEKTLLRVEGFTSPTGIKAENVELAMERAYSIVNYISDKHTLPANLFLIGLGADDSPGTPSHRLQRGEIAVYDDHLNLGIALVDRVVISKDGISRGGADE